jgi:hypothetical protein
MALFFDKKPALVRNGIAEQLKQAANSLTIQEWNQVVNTLKLQTNVTVEYLEKLHRFLFGTWTSQTIGVYETVDEGLMNELLQLVGAVRVTNPTDGQFLRYESATSQFKNMDANKVVTSATEPVDNKNNDIWFDI